MKLYFAFGMLFILSTSFAESPEDILCCGESYKVKYRSDFDGTTKIWCQKSSYGKFTKEGNYKVLNSAGVIIEQKIFNNDQEISSNRQILTCDKSLAATTAKAATSSSSNAATAAAEQRPNPSPTSTASNIQNPHISTTSCPSAQVENQLKDHLALYTNDIINSIKLPVTCKDQPHAHKLLLEREMMYSTLSYEQAAKRRPCLRSALLINHYQELSLVNYSAQIFCYLKANDPTKVQVKPKHEDFRYNFFSQNASPEQLNIVRNSSAVNQFIVGMQSKFQTFLGHYDSEISTIMSEARKEVTTFLNSTEGQSLKQKIANYDMQIRQELYP